MTEKIAILLPAYNEEITIQKLSLILSESYRELTFMFMIIILKTEQMN